MDYDLIAQVLSALGARIERVIVNDLKRGIYFARLILSAENELLETFRKRPLTAQDLLSRLEKRGPMFSESALKDLERTHDSLSTLPDDPWSAVAPQSGIYDIVAKSGKSTA